MTVMPRGVVDLLTAILWEEVALNEIAEMQHGTSGSLA